MYKFAKVFESNGFQVLVKKVKDEDVENTPPKISFIFYCACNTEVDIGSTFNGPRDFAQKKADRSFEIMDQSFIDGITEYFDPSWTAEELQAYINQPAE